MAHHNSVDRAAVLFKSLHLSKKGIGISLNLRFFFYLFNVVFYCYRLKIHVGEGSKMPKEVLVIRESSKHSHKSFFFLFKKGTVW